jgi:hypothetical protein
MRSSVLLVAAAALLGSLITSSINSSPALAASPKILAQCQDVNNVMDVDQNIAACNFILGDSKETIQSRRAALSNRCALWNIKSSPDLALTDCN